MSIVDSVGARVFLDPEPDRARPVKSERVRRRNREWLATQRRHDDLTVRDLAKLLGVRKTTLAEGLRWAAEQESRAEAAEVERLRREMCPVLDEASGLDLDDVLYLAGRYPPGDSFIEHPLVREVMAPLWARAMELLNSTADSVPGSAAA